MKKISIILLTLLSIILMSCSETKKDSYVDKLNENSSISLKYPVKLQLVEISGMSFMIAYGVGSDASISMINLTLDSLRVEYYKKSLNQDKIR